MKRFKKIYVEITNRCNLNCPFCIKNKRSIKDLSIKEVERIFIEISKFTDYVYLHLLGEPLLHENILEILDLANKYQLKVNITTNGTLLSNVYLSLLKKESLRQINISLHSLINYSKEKRKEYLKTITCLIKEVEKKKNVFLSLRLWVKNEALNKDILSDLEELLGYHPLDFDKIDHVYLSIDEEFVWPSLTNDYYKEKGICYGGITHLGILSNGDVVLCCLDSLGDTAIGNIFDDEFENILKNHKYINYLENRKKKIFTEELCKRCSYHNRFD